MKTPRPCAASAILVLAAWLTVAAAPASRSRIMPAAREKPVSFTLASSEFKPNGPIPRAHTCDGRDVSPPLSWSSPPPGTKSFALIVDDPDAPDPAAPRMTWVHWVVYGLPAAMDTLPPGMTAKTLPQGAREGLNDWKRPGWRGPCPPKGRHRYFHKLYALDVVLPDLQSPTKAALEKAMAGHVLGTAELVGTYQR